MLYCYFFSLGAKLPEKQTKSETKENEKVPEEPQELKIPYPELDESDVISADNDETLPMGDSSKEVSYIYKFY